MRHLGLFALVAWSAAAFGASDAAWAASVTNASGPIRVNGAEVRVDPAHPVALKEGDKIDTLQATATLRSDAGDEVALDPGTALEHQGRSADGATELLFLKWGSATALLGEKTAVGTAAGWASAAAGGKSRVFVAAEKARAATEGLFRAIDGGAWVRYDKFAVWLPKAHEVTLDVDPRQLGTLCFVTGQLNVGEVEIRKTVSGGDILAFVPNATTGCFEDAPNNKTRITNDVRSNATAKIRLETHFSGKPVFTAQIGPGTYALVDNATGTIEVVFAAVQFEILERAISLTSEFATLATAASNFFGVKKGP